MIWLALFPLGQIMVFPLGFLTSSVGITVTWSMDAPSSGGIRNPRRVEVQLDKPSPATIHADPLARLGLEAGHLGER